MSLSGKRPLAAGLAAGALVLLPAGASAQLGLPAPPVPPAPPVITNAVSGVTDPVGGVVSGLQGAVTGTVSSTIDQVLQGAAGATGAPGSSGAPATGGQLPPATVDSLLSALPPVTADGTGAVADTAAPAVRVTVLSRLTQLAHTGTLRLQVTSDEAGVVAVGGAVRPGYAVRGRSKGHRRTLVKWPAAVLAFRAAGTLPVTIRLSRADRINLGRSRNARIGVATIAADVRRNQRAAYVKREIRR
jgi:hypothetical protein